MALSGLSQKEIPRLQSQFGRNIIPSEQAKNGWAILAGALKAPMTLLLMACSIVYLLLGDATEGGLLSMAALFTAGLDFFQTFKTERALESLRNLTSPRALVVRDGNEYRISSQELVPGDLIVVSEGDRIPADAKLISSSGFSVDESLLTGESVPVPKSTTEQDITSELFSGTLVISGKGKAIVTATGAKSQIGNIGASLAGNCEQETQLQSSLKKLIKNIFLLSLFFLISVVLLSGLIQKNWLKAILLGLSTSISMIPEELPVVLTVFLGMGAWRMSRHRVLTRRVASLENLGAVSSLCVDKTGTLTENSMTLRDLSVNQEVFSTSLEDLPELFHSLLEYAALSSHQDPFDPMEKAILSTQKKYLGRTEHQHSQWELIREYPLTDQLRAMACVWKAPDRQKFIIAAKGAPEDIFDLCHINAAEMESHLVAVRKLASQGLRVLAVAKSNFDVALTLPYDTHDFDFTLVGLLGLEDPLRGSVPSALATCWRAGIKVFVLTGDYPITARRIAHQAGFPETTPIFLGQDLSRMSLSQIDKSLEGNALFSRMSHQNKLFLVEALQNRGEIVAMTGDGVNDAPSLKKADIGIAMGKRGTDVAREASDIILLDDDFAAIVTAIALGRKIYQQIKTAMTYTFSLHLPIGAMTLLPIFLGWPPLLEPLHLVLLELVIDPSCTIALGLITTSQDLMALPPRKKGFTFFDSIFFKPILLRGSIALFLCLSLPFFLMRKNLPEAQIRTYIFLTLYGSILGLFFGALPRKLERARQNWVWLSVYFLALLVLGVIFNFPRMQQILHFGSVPYLFAILALLFGILPCASTRYSSRH